MANFGSAGTGSGGDKGKPHRIIGKIDDIKAGPASGEKRVIVREKSGRRSTVAVDIPAKYTSELERRETYCFDAHQKNNNRDGSGYARKEPSFKSYHCDSKPTEYTGTEGRGDAFNRFGNSERGGGTDRSKRKFF